MGEHRDPLLTRYGAQVSQAEHIFIGKIQAGANRLQKSSTRKSFRGVAEKQIMGRLAGQALPHGRGVKQAVTPDARKHVQMGCLSGLKRGSVIKGGIGSVAQTVQEQDNDLAGVLFHALLPAKAQKK
jgi:hypothetical protein